MADISIIIPIYNGENWIDQCFNSIKSQSIFKYRVPTNIEIIVYNDGSFDKTKEILESWHSNFALLTQTITYIVINKRTSKGVGAARNAAVARSTGKYLCFQDIDDIMLPDRINKQWNVAKLNHNALIGTKVKRNPENSTARYVKWANNLRSKELKIQIYTSNGPTLLMPTWFCHKSVYEKVGGFDESGLGTPEDLIFFYKHLDMGGDLLKVDETLVIYTYHKEATTFTISRTLIRKIQVQRLENNVLAHWHQFTVWNAGKGGRKFVRLLSENNIKNIVAFCDIDTKKIGRVIELYSPEKRAVIAKIPVIHFSQIKPPVVICVKLDLYNGEFENNLNSLNFTEGLDYVLFC